MLYSALLVAHIIVVGYWLGSELVINSTYRYVSWGSAMPFAERKRLMEHVMHADQHVRYALVLQATLGTMLAALGGLIPGGGEVALAAAVLGVAWLTLVEATHRLRHRPAGAPLAAADRAIRYGAIVALAAFAVATATGILGAPTWLAWKLACFAGVIACGLGIRLFLIAFFRLWRSMESEGASEADEARIRSIYRRATGVLGLLWFLIGVIVLLSVFKPG